MEYTSGGSSWREAVRRAGAVLRRRSPEHRSRWSIGVPLIAATAGMLFTLSANTAAGTTLREDRIPELGQLIDKKQSEADALAQQADALRREIDGITSQEADSSGPVAEQLERRDSYLAAVGLTHVQGPGITVRLDDSPRRADNTFVDTVSQDQLLVHQQDIEAVVNALWAGGADAITIMGQRIINTTMIRCVGNTLLLHGKRYSPVFVVQAIGDPGRMQAALDASPGVQAFKAAKEKYQLGYSVTTESNVDAPEYTGSTELRHATVPE